MVTSCRTERVRGGPSYRQRTRVARRHRLARSSKAQSVRLWPRTSSRFQGVPHRTTTCSDTHRETGSGAWRDGGDVRNWTMLSRTAPSKGPLILSGRAVGPPRRTGRAAIGRSLHRFRRSTTSPGGGTEASPGRQGPRARLKAFRRRRVGRGTRARRARWRAPGGGHPTPTFYSERPPAAGYP